MVIQPIVLAAGRGTRIAEEAAANGLGVLPKVLYPLNGRPLIDYCLDVLSQTSWRPPIIVVHYQQEKIRDHIPKGKAIFVDQIETLGTGHAVKMGLEAVASDVDGVVVVNGDMPGWSIDTLKGLVETYKRSQPTLALGVVNFTDPIYNSDFFVYGRIVRDKQGQLIKIVEQKDATSEERQIFECNPSLYCFQREWLANGLGSLKNHNQQGEYYLTDLLEIAVRQNQTISTYEIKDWREAIGVNTLEQLHLAEQLLPARAFKY